MTRNKDAVEGKVTGDHVGVDLTRLAVKYPALDFSSGSSATDPASATGRGRCALVFLGLVLVVIGGLFVTLMGRSFLRAWAMREWPRVPCVILSSEIEERTHDPLSPREYRPAVTFGYEWMDQARTSDRLTLRGSAWTSRREAAERRLADFPVGSTTCLVSPDDPDLAVLVPDSLAPGYSIWFPALFVMGGIGMIVRSMARSGSKSGNPCPGS